MSDCLIVVLWRALDAIPERTFHGWVESISLVALEGALGAVADRSLLMIADHHPWGAANEQLATRLGVDMGKSTTFDPANSETGLPAQLNFSRVNSEPSTSLRPTLRPKRMRAQTRC